MKTKIREMIEEELNRANQKFPEFQSRHEAYAVMKEEWEEALAEVEDIKEGLLKDYWTACRESKKQNKGTTNELLNAILSGTVCAIAELIQLGAMAKKAKKLEEAYKDGGGV